MPRAGGVWRPGATLATLQRRAQILATIRTFFAARGVLEVDTPQLSPVTATDPLLASAAMDRLLHHSQVIRLVGDTYRNPKKNDPKKTTKKENTK